MWMGRSQEATATLDAVIQQPPRDRASYLARARALALRGRLGEALAAFDAAVAQVPNDPVALIGRAQTNARLARYPAEALAEFQRALELEPNNASALNGQQQARNLAGAKAGFLPKLRDIFS